MNTFLSTLKNGKGNKFFVMYILSPSILGKLHEVKILVYSIILKTHFIEVYFLKLRTLDLDSRFNCYEQCNYNLFSIFLVPVPGTEQVLSPLIFATIINYILGRKYKKVN